MLVRERLSAAIGFGYLGSISLLVAALLCLGWLLDRLDRSARIGRRYDSALVAVLVGLLRPIDRIPAAPAPPREPAESVPPADEPA